jgi:hypothetical protein
MTLKSMPSKFISICVLLYSASVLLTGCNNDSNQNAGQPAANSDDAFIAQVRLQTDGANAMSDTAEPIDIMQINETAPEQTEPQTVTF